MQPKKQHKKCPKHHQTPKKTKSVPNVPAIKNYKQRKNATNPYLD